MKKALFRGSIFVASVMTVSAQVNQVKGRQIIDLLNLAQTVINRLSPILVTIALLAFFWFLIKFIWLSQDNPGEQAKAKKGMFYGILALFVMVSIWGIIAFLQNLFGVSSVTTQPVVNPLPPGMRE